MPIPSPGTYDVASQATLVAVKAKTDLIPAVPAEQAKIDASLYTSRLAPVFVSGNTPATTTTTITIQPPVGETWRIRVIFTHSAAAASTVTIRIRNAADTTFGRRDKMAAYESGVDAEVMITNTYYLELLFYNADGGARPYGYSYFGWVE